MVGAGGIGCELLKNLVLAGFRNIDVVDLDTIDVSNLNRQFLFHKQHVGKPKATVAVESVLRFAPTASIQAFHCSIMSEDWGVDRFGQYALVLNALDNKAARSHVNRLCLAAEVPLVESGSAGYLGQVVVIKKGVSECYECTPKTPAKTFPGCTIRNTPSEPIHCIVWAKHLFAQLFGEVDIDDDVAPDPHATPADEETGEEGQNGANGNGANGDGAHEASAETTKKSTRAWAEEMDYDGAKLFRKLFQEDILYLLSMAKLWQKRRAPEPLNFEALESELPSASRQTSQGLRDKRVWAPSEAGQVFVDSVRLLAAALKKAEGKPLVWDKDDPAALDFVTAAANLRSTSFHIPLKSRFEVKSMAGNIIPAIATTNAIVGGLICLEAIKILRGRVGDCRSTFVVRKPNPRGKILVDMELEPPSKDCIVCAEKPSASVALNPATMTVKALEEKVLKGALGFVAPDAQLEDAGGAVIISSEEGELDSLGPKALQEMKVTSGTRLMVDDFLQRYKLRLSIVADAKLEGDAFRILSDLDKLKAETAAAAEEEEAKEASLAKEAMDVMEVPTAKRLPGELDEDSAPPAKAPKIA